MLRYLGAYTHRVAISNGRLVALSDGNVTFRWRDSDLGLCSCFGMHAELLSHLAKTALPAVSSATA